MVRRPRGSVLVSVIVALAVVAAVAQLLNMRQGMAGSRIALRQEAAVARHLAEAGLRDALWRARRDEPALVGERSMGELGTYSAPFVATTNGIAVTATGKVPSGATAVLQRSYYVPCYGKPKTTSLLPYALNGDPSTIYESTGGVNDRKRLSVDLGNHVEMADNETRIVIKFDTTAIDGKEIASAKLLMDLKEYDSAMEGANVFVHYLMQGFNAKHVTWTHATGNTTRDLWVDANKVQSPGGYYHPQPSSTARVTPTKSIYEWNLQELVAQWTDPDTAKKLAQHGVIIRTDKTSSHSNHPFHFYGTEQDTRKPRLRVVWCEKSP